MAKTKEKPFLRVYFDVETYALTQEEAIDYPEITVVKTGLVNPETNEIITKPRRVVNTRVYGIAWTYVTGLVTAEDPKYRNNVRDFEWEDQYQFNEIPEGYQTYEVLWGKDCIELFLAIIMGLATRYNVQLWAFNTTFDFHQIIWDIKKHYDAEGLTPKEFEIKSVLGNDIQITGEVKLKRSKDKRKRKLIFKDLWQFQKGRGLSTWLTEISKLYENVDISKGEIEYNKYDMQFDKNGFPVRYKKIIDGVETWEDFDYVKENEYLYKDVIYLPLIRKEIEVFKREVVEALFEDVAFNANSSEWELRERINVCCVRSNTEAGFSKRLQDTYLRWVLLNDPRMNTIFPKLKNYRMNPNDKLAKKSGMLYDMLFRPRCTIEELEPQLAGYFGGFVSGNKYISEWEGKLGILIDVNSMYPWVMSGYMPYGELLERPPYCMKSDNPYDDESYCTWYLIDGQDLPKWKDKYDCFDNNILGKCFFMKAYFTKKYKPTMWWILKDYWDLINKMCKPHKLKIESVYYMRTRRLMKPYMDKVMSIKKKYTPTKNGEGKRKYEGAKVLANSAYGKLAERPHDDTMEFNNSQGQYFDRPDCEYRSLFSGMYVTSMSRVKLLSTIKELIDNGNTFLYCDTDSIMFDASGNYDFIKYHQTELGAWDIERVFNRFVYNGKRKKYCLEWSNSEDVLSVKTEFLNWYLDTTNYKLNDKEISKLFSRKGTTSGYPTSIATDLENWEEIKVLYHPANCVVIKQGKKIANTDNLTMKKQMYNTDGFFNSSGEYMGDYLVKENGKWTLKHEDLSS